jgi:hypothetical protein
MTLQRIMCDCVLTNRMLQNMVGKRFKGNNGCCWYIQFVSVYFNSKRQMSEPLSVTIKQMLIVTQVSREI